MSLLTYSLVEAARRELLKLLNSWICRTSLRIFLLAWGSDFHYYATTAVELALFGFSWLFSLPTWIHTATREKQGWFIAPNLEAKSISAFPSRLYYSHFCCGSSHGEGWWPGNLLVLVLLCVFCKHVFIWWVSVLEYSTFNYHYQ